MKKWLSILLSLVLTLSFFSVSQAEEQATVTFWLDDMTDARMEMVEKIISTFEASHPNIKIEFTGLPEDSTDKLMLAFEAGIAPDILNITSKNIATYIENGYLSLYNVCSGEGDINYGWTQLAGAFQTGVAAIIQHNTGSSDAHYAAFNGDLTKFEAVPFPTSQTGNRVMQSLSWDGFAINSTAKDKEAAWEFLYYLCAAEGAAIYTEAIGLVPCVTELLTSEDSYVQNPEKPWMQTAAAVITDPTTLFYDCPTYMPSYSGALSSEIDPLVQQTMAGELTAQELLDTWAQIMNDMYAEEGK